jgi:alginate biosynthesis protein AlgX
MRTPRFFVPAAFILLMFGFAAQASATNVSAPVYEARPCCALCPEVRDARRYDTKFLKNSRLLVQGEGDWLFRSELDLRTDFDYVDAGRSYLKKLREAFARRGIELVVVYQPTRGLVHRGKLTPEVRAGFNFDLALANYRAALGHFGQLGIHAPDLSRLVDEHEEHAFYFRDDAHWTPYGAQRTAKVVAEAVRRLPAFANIPRRVFVSRLTGRNTLGTPGTLRDTASQLCNANFAADHVDRFSTEPKEEASGDDLFGDSNNPQIVLVGTSHSGPAYNFSGFLQEYLGADLLNFSFPGGGLQGGMIEYLGSEEFRSAPPKVLIWEFSPIYRLDMDRVYRQFFALLDGGCDGKLELVNKTRLGPGKQTVLVNSAPQMLANRNARIDVRFTDPTVKTFRGSLLYMNGRKESLQFDKQSFAATNGRFAFDMRTDADWGDMVLLSLELEAPPESGGTPQELEVRVCRRTTAKQE